MLSFLRTIKIVFTRYAQSLFVLLIFALMVASSYYFINNIELNHLRRYAGDAILYTEANIKSDMLEPETLLVAVAETIMAMVISGADSEAVNNYFSFVNNYVDSDTGQRLSGVAGFYGYFDIFDGKFLMGSGSFQPSDDYDVKNRPWYSGAVNAAGEVSITEPYISDYSNEITITLSRRISDREGNQLGIICVDIVLNRIMHHAVNARFADDGYGFLLSENMMLIAHPVKEMVGTIYTEIRNDITGIIQEVLEKGSISEVRTTDYRGVNSIVFIQRLYNGWFMGVVTPKDNYFQSTRNLMAILVSLGVVFASLLIWMLLSVSEDKTKSEIRVRLMFDATPLAASFWNKEKQMLDCNQNAVKLFDLSDKQVYIDRFFELTPEYQPDGRNSQEKVDEFFAKAMDEGFVRFEWMHQKLNGELLPCEISLIRDKYRDEYIIVSYTRDLREQKRILSSLEQRTRLLDTVNTAAAILLANNDMTAFENSLQKCFELIGYCLDVDRVQIWRNELVEDQMHFVLRHEWLSEHGKTCKDVPFGLHFPYSLRGEWEELFLNGVNINSPISQLPAEDQAFLGVYDMKSIVIIPMFLDNDFWGFFSIDDCRNERAFSHEEISILTSAGLMMVSAANRNIQSKKMREAEERAMIMLDAAPLCTIFWDANLNLIDCNQEAVNLFGLSSKQEFIDNFNLLSPEYQSDGAASNVKGYELVKKALDEGYSRFDWMHQKMDGEPIPADVVCIRVKHKGEFTVTEYIRDLREQKAKMAEMRKAEIAEESSKAKSDFLARMSHEIRTPMNAILGITEIQLQDEEHPQGTREAFERIYNSGGLLLGIINDILDLSKIEAGKLVLVPAQYDIASLIHDTVQLNILRYESKPLEFILDVNEEVPAMPIGDELRIKQILNNVLSNAFKYTREGKVGLTVFTEPDDDNDAKITLVFVVSDTGQGMTADQVAKLGTEYSRFNLEANRRTEGTGLGMNITRNLINLMNGTISIESTPGMGSVFTVRLPQSYIDDSVIGKELAKNLMQMNHDSTMKIRTMQLKREFMPYGSVLVVDDVETNLYVAKGLMMPYGLKIETVMSGFEAIDKIRDGNVYDIIFMDHMMPRMDGIEATKIIRSLGYTKPVVALTANALSGQAEIFLQNGFDDFISKPIDIRQLNLTLNRLVRDKQPQDVIETTRKLKESLIFGNGRGKLLDPQLAEFFVKDAKKATSILEAIYLNKCNREDDISTFIINIHAMKSALANIGMMDMSAEAEKFENAGRENNTKLILSELPSFLQQLYAVIEKLEPKEEKTVNADEANYPLLKEKLLVIKSACASLDRKTAKDELANLREKPWSQDINNLLGNIAGRLLHSEFDEIVKVIDGFVMRL